MRLRVRHVTTYDYDAEVTASYGIARLLPRDLPGQLVSDATVAVSPSPEDVRERADHFGNRLLQFELRQPHLQLRIDASMVVGVGGRDDVVAAVRSAPSAARPWEEAPEATTGASGGAAVTARAMRLDSPRIVRTPTLRAFALETATPGRPLVDMVRALGARIHADFAFDPGATSVHTTIEQVLDARAGVCQDFAHLMIGALRSLGIAARYVSGYLETDPPPGQPRLQGADASHAWVQVWVPGEGGGWLDVDPTNDTTGGSRHVAIAVGRDYGDVAPLQGVIFTDAASSLRVEVDVERLPDG